MKRPVLPMIAVLAACDGTPLAPDRQPAFRVSSSVTVSARSQVVTLEFSSGESAQVSFKARFHAATPSDPTAQMDGAILVVSAVDGPMPQIGGASLSIEVSRATVNRAGAVQFEGTGIVSTGRVVLDQYPITGSARPTTVDPGRFLWEIVGGVWEVQFEALTKVSGLQQ
jgi:hypothetical protein